MSQVLYKSKSKAELRAEGEKALKKFLKSGGTVEIVKAKRAPKQKMRAKNSKGFQGSTAPAGVTSSNFWR
jgi:hypothetical protein